MIHFAQAEYLTLILVIPLLFILHGINRAVRKRRLARLGDKSVIDGLIPGASAARGWIKLSFLSLALFFFALGLARPQMGARIKEVEGKGAEIMIALDVSNSMLAQDYSPNRIERAKLAVSRLTDRLQEDRIGLIVFAGQAFVQLPVTTDYVSARMFLNSINTGSVSVQGTSLSEAINLGIRSFSDQTNTGKALILITDGEDHEDDPVSVAKTAREMGIVVYTIGIGSQEGKPIPLEQGELLKDKDGNIVVSRLNEEILVKVAEAGGGRYIRAGNNDFGLESIVDHIRSLDQVSFRSVVFEDFNEQYMYFFAIALFFFVLESLITDRRGRLFFK